ncbi:MAG TPA: hypothetical protein VG015_08435 [Candidatus Dormibacteraeota bacterium]|nr:hypothetical protein [Candidatus Dormibacteraeota bacterium]
MRPEGRKSPSGAELAGLGVFLAAAVVLPFLGGLALDGALHSAPIGVMSGLFVGIAAAVGAGYSRFKRYL